MKGTAAQHVAGIKGQVEAEWGKAEGRERAEPGIRLIFISKSLRRSLFDGDNHFIGADHVKPRARGSLYGVLVRA
jgi:hypothetical protein